ncbi:hypothetical protein MTO96_013429 [Rhipicephalus appendiculatus]
MELGIQSGRRVPAHRLMSRIPETRLDQVETMPQGSLIFRPRPASSLLVIRTSGDVQKDLGCDCVPRMAPVSTPGVLTDDCSLEPLAPSGDCQGYINGAPLPSERSDDSILEHSIWPGFSLMAAHPGTPCAARGFADGCILGPSPVVWRSDVGCIRDVPRDPEVC